MNGSTVNNLVGRIVELVHPLKVIIFGSLARGDSVEVNDIDLLVIMPNGTHRRHTAQRLYCEIKDCDMPFDAVVATPEDLERHKFSNGLIYRKALSEGKELYAATA
jgi:predicted nucleotidyltransferase